MGLRPVARRATMAGVRPWHFVFDGRWPGSLSSRLARDGSMANCGPATVALGLVLASRAVHAFSVANHEALTRAAVRQVEACIASGAEAASDLAPVGESEAALVHCDSVQDNLIRKVLVWHFYSPDTSSKRTGGWCHCSARSCSALGPSTRRSSSGSLCSAPSWTRQAT